MARRRITRKARRHKARHRGKLLREEGHIFQMGKAEGRAEILAQIDPVLFGNGEKYLDDLWIELRAGTAANFLAGVGHGQGVAIWAIAQHGVKSIGDGEDA